MERSPDIEVDYRDALLSFLRSTTELDLSAAFELGKRALVDDVSLPEVVRIHNSIVAGISVEAVGVADAMATQQRCNTFLTEALMVFEMSQRGYREVVEELRSVVQRLRDLDKVKTGLVAMVAHDLREPLAVVTGFAEMLCDDDGFDEATRRQYHELIRDHSRRMNDLIGDILSMSAIESGQLVLDLAELDMHRVVATVVQDLGAERAGRLDVEIAEEMRPVIGDFGRQVQVLANLVSNAFKFSDPGARVTVSVGVEGDMARVAVIDRGRGIRPEDAARLFQRFTRIDDEGYARTPGTGLGLWIARSLVEAQGGHLMVESTPGKGSTFAYTVPLGSPIGARADASLR